MAVGTQITIGSLIVTGATITGTVDQMIAESGSENTAPQKKEAFNPRMEATIEGIDDGYAPTNTFTAKGLTFQTTSAQRSRTTGDVAKYTITGVHYPDLA